MKQPIVQEEANDLTSDLVDQSAINTVPAKSLLEQTIGRGSSRFNTIDMMSPWNDPNIDEDLNEQTRQRISEAQSKTRELTEGYDIEGEFSEILSSLKERLCGKHLRRVEKALINLKKILDGDYVSDIKVFDKEGYQGAINYHILEEIGRKIIRQESITSLEDAIFDVKAALLNTVASWSGRYPPLHIREEWSGTERSPFYDEFVRFVSKLNSILDIHRIASTRDEVNKILGLKRDYDLERRIQKMSGVQKKVVFTIAEESFDQWYIRLKNHLSLTPTKNSVEAMAEIEDLFDITYKKFGYKGYHPLYRSAKLLVSNLGEVLVDAGVIASNVLRKMDNALGHENTRDLYRYLSMYPYAIPEIDPVKNLKQDFINLVKDKGDMYVDLIKNLMDEHIDERIDLRDGRDLLKSRPDCYRKTLITNIVDRCRPLQQIYKRYGVLAVSKLIFGGEDNHILQSFLKDGDEENRPDLDHVFQIISNSQLWNFESFSEFSEISITDIAIESMKSTILREVKDWIFNVRTFKRDWLPYMSSKKDMKGELNLMLSLWIAAAMHENNPRIKYSEIARIELFGRKSNLVNTLRRGKYYSTNAVRKMYRTLNIWIKDEAKINPHSQKLDFYFSCQKEIFRYAADNDLHILNPLRHRLSSAKRRISSGLRFEEEYAIAYHVIVGLGKHLGFDPYDFTLLDDQSFNAPKRIIDQIKQYGRRISLFVRHHFRNSVGRDSFFHGDIIITNKIAHGAWETLSEAESLIILRGYEKLIAIRGSGKKIGGISGLNEITVQDIESVFKGEEWVYARWYANRDFKDNLESFNMRRKQIRVWGLEEFIKKNNPVAYNRFYENVLLKQRDSFQDLLSQIHPIPKGHKFAQLLDINRITNAKGNKLYLTEITRYLTNLLHIYGSPIPLL